MPEPSIALQNAKRRIAEDFYPSKGKYLFDATVAFILLILLIPLFLIVSLLIKLGSKGPVFFRQDRIGLKGDVFRIYKFRSMTVLDDGENIVQAKRGDARITKIGAFLRKTSMDELPQLINVLYGDMSLVGPRPHAVSHDKDFASRIEEYVIRYNVLPGITGYAQVNGLRGETDTKEKLFGRTRYDVKYVYDISFLLDLKILFKTFWIVIISKNAY